MGRVGLLGGDTQFNFGMHRGSTYLEVLRQHPDYYHWGLQEKKPSPQLTATSSGTSSETGVEVEDVDTTAAASALINIAEPAFATATS